MRGEERRSSVWRVGVGETVMGKWRCSPKGLFCASAYSVFPYIQCFHAQHPTPQVPGRIPDGEHLRHRRSACQRRILPLYIRRRRAREDDEVHDAALCDPLRVGAVTGCGNIDEHLGGVEPTGENRRIYIHTIRSSVPLLLLICSLLNVTRCIPTPHTSHQSTPVVRPTLCATIIGMAPYSPKGDESRYSNTSRLYRRYGSEVPIGGEEYICEVHAVLY